MLRMLHVYIACLFVRYLFFRLPEMVNKDEYTQIASTLAA